MCQSCSLDSNLTVKCNKCINNLDYNATTDKCTCKSGYAIDAAKNCTKCSSLVENCETCSQSSDSTIQCDKCVNNLKYDSTSKKCGCEDGSLISENVSCVKCSSLVENCETCSQGSSSTIKCDKCVNNLKYDSTSKKCGCEDGYNLNTNKTCEKIPDPIPDNNDDYIKIKSWQFLLGLGVLVVLNILFMLGVAYCVKKRMRSRQESSLLGSEQDTIVDFPRPTGNSYARSGQQNHYGQYGQYPQYGQEWLPKVPAEKQYFEEKRNEGERSWER
jgi:hypothetical protein